ncbi:MAG: hypothetical protein KJZ91_27840 [Myxococcales bacterium]|nr:hypothetical protein [Myxococcales bacterium]
MRAVERRAVGRGSHHGRNRAFGSPPDIQDERQDTHVPGDASAYGDSGRLACVVRNDDTEAVLDPLQPELGCDPPSSGSHMTVRFPFAFPGQLIAPGTHIEDDVGTRPALVLNNARVYDPLLGAYLQPDPADPYVRTPEGYAYARNNPLHWIDPTGMRSIPESSRVADGLWFEDSCGVTARGIVGVGTAIAAVKLTTCLACILNPGLRDRWHLALLKAREGGAPGEQGRDGQMTAPRNTYVSAVALVVGGASFHGLNCMAAALAHEALHQAIRWPVSTLNTSTRNTFDLIWERYSGGGTRDGLERVADAEEVHVARRTRTCFPDCPDPARAYGRMRSFFPPWLRSRGQGE